MPTRTVKKIFNYPTKKVIDLILNINEYKNFLPWCNESMVHSKEEKKNYDIIIADLEIGYKIFSDTYSSKVIYDKKKNIIEVSCLAGPVETLSNISESLKEQNDHYLLKTATTYTGFFIKKDIYDKKQLNDIMNKSIDRYTKEISISKEGIVLETL